MEKKMQTIRKAAHKAIDDLFDALASAIALAGPGASDQADPNTTGGTAVSGTVPQTNGKSVDATLEADIADALAATGRRRPLTQERKVDESDRAIVLTVRRQTEDKDWPAASKRLQANLKLTRQQVAGIVASASRAN